MKGIIYKATDNWNGKVYIGQTVVGLKRRRSEHEKDAKKLSDHNAFHFALSVRDFDFKWEVIDTFEGDADFVHHALNVAEEYHIIKCRSAEEEYGYNSTYGGYSSDKFADHYKAQARARGCEAKVFWQYDLDGNFVREFSSLTEIATAFDRPKLKASDLKEGVGQWRGYQWRRKVGKKPSPKIAKYEMAKKVTVGIAMYGSDGNLIKTFKKRIDAEKECGRFSVRDDFTKEVVLPYHLRDNRIFYRIPYNGEYPESISVTIKEPAKKPTGIKSEKIGCDQYDRDGKFVARFSSLTEAERVVGFSRTAIKNFCSRPEPIAVNARTKWIWRSAVGEPRQEIDIIPYAPPQKPEMQERRILQYSLEGDYIATHKNMIVASKVSHDPYGKIRNSCDGKQMFRANYQWRYYAEGFEMKIPPFAPRQYKPRPERAYKRDRRVLQYSREGEYLATFESIREASRTSGDNYHRIIRMCLGGQLMKRFLKESHL